MANITSAASELREMDDLAMGESSIHALHPLGKLIVTIAYVFITVSFGKYDLNGLLVMVIYPALLFSVSGISVKTCLYKLRMILPLVCFVGLFNPLLDRQIVMSVGQIGISGGLISMLTLLLKGVFCLMASFLLAATTPMDAICAALRMLHVPGILVTMLLLTYRYVSVMIEEVGIMTTAYALRAPGQKGIHISAWGSFLGQLLLRSMDRAEELYSSMLLRGFHGEFRYAGIPSIKRRDLLYCSGMLLLLLVLRFVPVGEMLGNLVM